MRRFTSRLCLGLAILVTAAGVCATIGLLRKPVARITRAACDEIQPGMTVAEVEAVIGAPPGRYDGIHSFGTNAPGAKRRGAGPEWVGYSGHIVLTLDDLGNVQEAGFYPITVISASFGELAAQRLTGNAFGVRRANLVVAAGRGVLLGCVLAGLAVMVALGLRRHSADGVAYGLSVVGAVFSFSALLFGLGAGVAVLEEFLFYLAGMGAGGLVVFVIGAALVRRAIPPNPKPVPIPTLPVDEHHRG